MTRTRRAAAGLVATAAVVVAAAGYFLLAWWTLSVALAETADQARQRLDAGWHWSFDRPADLVGGMPVGMAGEIEDGRLVGTSDGSGYLSLNFHGEKLDAALFHRLQLELDLDRPARLLLYHREWLDGPVISAEPIELRSGQQMINVDLATLRWESRSFDSMGTPVSAPVPSTWGGTTGTVASLRMHLIAQPEVRYWIDALSIQPAVAVATESIPWPAPSELRTLPRALGIEVPVFGHRPERVLQERHRVEQLRPATVWSPDLELPSLPGWLLPLTAFLAAFLAAGRRPALALIGFAAASLWLLGMPAGWQWQQIAAGGLLLSTGAVLYRHGLAVGPHRGRSRAAWAAAAAGLVVLALPAVTQGPQETLPAAWMARLAWYLPWALLQQLILQRLLVPAAGGHQQTRAVLIGAIIFGLLHWPNFALMVATLLLGLLTALHFRHYGRLLPVAAAHAVLGTVYLTFVPREWLWSGAVGWRYFG